MVRRTAMTVRAGLACSVLLAAPRAADAADIHLFRLPAEPVDAALLRFAVQGDVSVGGFPARGCEGRSHAVLGPMPAVVALRRLLPSGCGFETVDARTFRIVGRAAAAPSSDQAPHPAAPAVSVKPALVDEVVVTAERRLEPLTGSAFAISVLSGDEVQRLGGRSFADAALQMAGVTVTNLGPGRNKIFIRGLSDGSFTGQTQSTVGLYLDDVPITYSAPDPDLRLVDIRRIEVLRGPQGSLYGSGSIGGIVRIVTNPPDPQAFGGAVTVEGEASEHGAPSSGVDATLNAPLPGAIGAIRVSAYRDRRGGYIDNPELGLTDVNATTRTGVRLATSLALPAGWGITATYTGQAIDTRDSQYVRSDDPGLTRDTAVREPHDNDFAEVGATVTHSGQRTDFRLSAAFIDHDLNTRYDATRSLGAAGPAAFDDLRRVDLTVVDALLASTTQSRVRWLVGLYASEANETAAGRRTELGSGSEASGSQGASAQGSSAETSVYRRRDAFTEGAVYGEATLDLTDRIFLTAGGRLFTGYLSSRIGDLDLMASPPPAAHHHLKTGGFAPKLRLSYAVSPETVVYAQLQEGYRSGGFNVPAGASGGLGADAAGTAFKPDRLLSYEVGAVWPLFHDRVKLRAAAFRAAWKHVQTDQYQPSGLPLTVNIGDGTNTGVEAEAAWRPDDHWRLRANLLLDDPEITHVSDAFPASADVGLPGVPRVQVSADAGYGWTVGPRLRATISAQYSYVGRSHLTFDGAASSLMGGYGVGRVAIELKGRDFRLQAFVDNVADTRGNTFAFGNPFSRAMAAQETPLRPRSIGLAIQRGF